jgi:hypothetical protein
MPLHHHARSVEDPLAIDHLSISGNQDHSTISRHEPDLFQNIHATEDLQGLNGQGNVYNSQYRSTLVFLELDFEDTASNSYCFFPA